VHENLLAVVADDKAVSLGWVKPLDPAVQLAAIVDALAAVFAELGHDDLHAPFGEASLLLDGKEEILTALLAMDQHVSKVHDRFSTPRCRPAGPAWPAALAIV